MLRDVSQGITLDPQGLPYDIDDIDLDAIDCYHRLVRDHPELAVGLDEMGVKPGLRALFDPCQTYESGIPMASSYDKLRSALDLSPPGAVLDPGSTLESEYNVHRRPSAHQESNKSNYRHSRSPTSGASTAPLSMQTSRSLPRVRKHPHKCTICLAFYDRIGRARNCEDTHRDLKPFNCAGECGDSSWYATIFSCKHVLSLTPSDSYKSFRSKERQNLHKKSKCPKW
jgi:hypothetical protein